MLTLLFKMFIYSVIIQKKQGYFIKINPQKKITPKTPKIPKFNTKEYYPLGIDQRYSMENNQTTCILLNKIETNYYKYDLLQLLESKNIHIQNKLNAYYEFYDKPSIQSNQFIEGDLYKDWNFVI
jgi:hypothetical protein